MFLGVDKLLDLVKSRNLVEGLCERELKNPEGCGFDLRLGEVFQIKGEGFLGVDERKTCDTKLVASISRNDKEIVLKPGDFYLVKTIEKVNMPSDLVGIFKPRSTLHRMGILLRTSQVSPGYQGELIFAMVNLGPCPVKLELGSRIVHLMFAEIDGTTSLYRGQWQGGRVTTQDKEKQV